MGGAAHQDEWGEIWINSSECEVVLFQIVSTLSTSLVTLYIGRLVAFHFGLVYICICYTENICFMFCVKSLHLPSSSWTKYARNDRIFKNNFCARLHDLFHIINLAKRKHVTAENGIHQTTDLMLRGWVAHSVVKRLRLNGQWWAYWTSSSKLMIIVGVRVSSLRGSKNQIV